MLTIRLESLTCREDTTEWGSDEPYVLVASVIPGDVYTGHFPQAHVTLHWFPDTDVGDTHASNLIIWGLDGEPADLDSADDAIFIVALMEWDDGHPHAVRSLVSSGATVALGSNLGQPRDVLAAALIEDISGILSTPTGAPSFDEVIGVQELRLTEAELAEVKAGQEVRKTLAFAGDGGRFQLTFLARMDAHFRSPDYRWSRLEGYVVDPEVSDAKSRGLLELNGFYDKYRGDYFTTPDPSYAGVTRIDPNYGWSRLEGYVFAQGSQPAGTVPMYSWWSRSRKDNLSTTNPQYTDPLVTRIAPGYGLFKEDPVYVYSPKLPQPPNTLPLHRWYSPGRHDNATLTHPSWRP